MSTLTVSNVSDGSLAIPTTYVTNGSAKAWVNFNGTGTIAARDSFNVSSLTDNGTGDYTVNFTNAFGAADYSFAGNGNNPSDLAARIMISADGSGVATGSLRFDNIFGFDGSVVDGGTITLSMHGDLA